MTESLGEQRVPVHLRVGHRGPPRQDRRPDLRRRPRRGARATTPTAASPARPWSTPASWSSPARSRPRPTSTSRRSPARRSASIGYTDADLGFSADSCAVHHRDRQAVARHRPGRRHGARGAHRPRRRRRARRRRRRRPGDDVRLRDPRDAGADAAADLARPPARPAPRRGPQAARWSPTCAPTARPRSPSATRTAGRSRSRRS